MGRNPPEAVMRPSLLCLLPTNLEVPSVELTKLFLVRDGDEVRV
jgi:hypothetical protein